MASTFRRASAARPTTDCIDMSKDVVAWLTQRAKYCVDECCSHVFIEFDEIEWLIERIVTTCVDTSASLRSANPNRHLVEVPDTFSIARWPRNADVATIARCILGTLKYEPHAGDTTALRRALESVLRETEIERRGGLPR
jgi:hypothetical protein